LSSRSPPPQAGDSWILRSSRAVTWTFREIPDGTPVIGEEGLDEFRETKHVHLDYKQELKSYWYPYKKYNRLSSA